MTRDERLRRRLAVVLTVCCLALIPWIVFLALTLPVRYQSAEWKAAWLGFDVLLLVSLTVTAWAAYRGRQVIILAGFVTATLLVCDAWFDVLLDSTAPQLWLSLASAVLLELPLAAVLIVVSQRLLMASIRRVWRMTGEPGPAPSLLHVPMLGASDTIRQSGAGSEPAGSGRRAAGG